MNLFTVQEKRQFLNYMSTAKFHSGYLISNYSDKTFVNKLRSIKFPDYLNSNCVNNACQHFVITFLSPVDSVSSNRTLRVKSNTKPWFDTDV